MSHTTVTKIIVFKAAEKLSLFVTESFFQHKLYSEVLDVNEFNVVKENDDLDWISYFGKSSCSFTISGDHYALGNCPEPGSDPERCFQLWKVGSAKMEPTETDIITVDSEMFGWKCTTIDHPVFNDTGHMFLVQNDGVSLLENFIFDEYGLIREDLHELKAGDNNDLK